MPGAQQVKEHTVGDASAGLEMEHSLVHSQNASDMSLASQKTKFHPGSPVTRLPVELDVSVPVRDFRVRDLLSLVQGQLIESQWGHGEDLPLNSGAVQMAWTEFEVVDTRLAVRITRLA
jgi:flagellar motor switch/type III secretory pathway protein FliN